MRYELSHLVQEPSQAIFRPIQDDEALLLFALCRVTCARAEVVEVIVRRFEQTLAGGKEVTGSQFWKSRSNRRCQSKQSRPRNKTSENPCSWTNCPKCKVAKNKIGKF